MFSSIKETNWLISKGMCVILFVFNPNKTGLFEGSFQEELVKLQQNFIQLFKNLFKVC